MALSHSPSVQERKVAPETSSFPNINGLPVITHHLLNVKGGLMWARSGDLAIYFTSWCHKHVSSDSVGSKSLKHYLE